ncbi:cholesterol 7-alpha-monooxygenase [Acrodontium crateriforme]|uniref:Cholesterol 7-alpha-monooxygenase n=1 Tax=Acrodontium crateriforme TaxID=150365 RepID=A0AAQ3R9Q9_9PEZI|nr:cholesterol 7-alpha-monooxygenase [Acrodontium crateriforme]
MHTVNELAQQVPKLVAYTLAPVIFGAVLVTLLRAYTTLNYYWALRQFTDSPHAGKKDISSPQIPYTLPFFGNTFSFLTSNPFAYWVELFSWHSRNTGILTLLVGGRKTHIVFAPAAVQALFKSKTPNRDIFEVDLFKKVFEFTSEQLQSAIAGKDFEHEMNATYLVKHEKVNELTAGFCKVLDEVLSEDAADLSKLGETQLYIWLRKHMFEASVTALMGENLLKQYPDFMTDFYQFDQDFMKFFFQLPFMGKAIANRKRIFDKIEAWSLDMLAKSGGSPIDPDGPAWEPLYGSRLNRARQKDYKNRGLNSRSSAALDLGIVFALASNVIPTTGWMLMHIIDPAGDLTLLPRVLAEVKSSAKPDGTFDVPTLIAQPLLQSIWTEALRLYSDVLVTRNIRQDITLPLDADGKRTVTLHNGDNIFAPSWIGHNDPIAWASENVSISQFHAERFLTIDPVTGNETFSLNGTTGKYFPFGGGKTICPGRVFAKQEALGALAMILFKFDFEILRFEDSDGKPTKSFPGFAKAFPGSGALSPGGDFRVKIKNRV